MKLILFLLIMVLASGCEPLIDDLFDNITCNYQGYPTHKDNYGKCYYINDVGIQLYINESYCNCLL